MGVRHNTERVLLHPVSWLIAAVSALAQYYHIFDVVGAVTAVAPTAFSLASLWASELNPRFGMVPQSTANAVVLWAAIAFGAALVIKFAKRWRAA
ncbi:MAG: hypothetical protein ABEI77_07570 [Halorientalis sp.]